MPKPDIRVATFAGPGAKPKMETVPWPTIPDKAALIKIGACGVCGTDQHILKGHWPKPLPWPFTLGHELGGIIVEKGQELSEDFMGHPLEVGSRIMIPPLMPCGSCYYCVHYPQTANKCLTPVYYGRYLGFEKPPHLWGGWAEYVYVDLGMLPGTKIYKLPDDMSLRLGSLSEPLTSGIRALNRARSAHRLEVGDQRGRRGVAPRRLLLEALEDHRLQVGRHVVAQLAQERRVLVQDGVQDPLGVGSGEGGALGEQLVQRDAQAPHVRAPVDLLAADLLRAHVQGRADQIARIRSSCPRPRLSRGRASPKSVSFDAIAVAQQVGRLDVPVQARRGSARGPESVARRRCRS